MLSRMFNSHKEQYDPLLTDPSTEESPSEGDTYPPPPKSSIPRSKRTVFDVVVVLQAVIILALVGVFMAYHSSNCPAPRKFGQILYSPAMEAVEYLPKTFGVGNDNGAIYQGGPSASVDKAWLDLYNYFGLSRISKDQARMLPNKTLPIPGDEDHYAVSLAVFHQIHCINILRKATNPAYYADPITGEFSGVAKEDWSEHLEHCLEVLREAVTCASDISLVVWQWDDKQNQAVARMDTVHSCRDFVKIQDWARAHQWVDRFDNYVHVEDDIEIPVF